MCICLSSPKVVITFFIIKHCPCCQLLSLSALKFREQRTPELILSEILSEIIQISQNLFELCLEQVSEFFRYSNLLRFHLKQLMLPISNTQEHKIHVSCLSLRIVELWGCWSLIFRQLGRALNAQPPQFHIHVRVLHVWMGNSIFLQKNYVFFAPADLDTIPEESFMSDGWKLFKHPSSVFTEVTTGFFICFFPCFLNKEYTGNRSPQSHFCSRNEVLEGAVGVLCMYPSNFKYPFGVKCWKTQGAKKCNRGVSSRSFKSTSSIILAFKSHSFIIPIQIIFYHWKNPIWWSRKQLQGVWLKLNYSRENSSLQLGLNSSSAVLGSCQFMSDS